jgi:hypothetical protein
VNAPCRIKGSVHALVAFMAAATLASPLGGRQMAIAPQGQSHKADMVDDDDLAPVNEGVLLLLDRSPASNNADWMKFETDQCGFLERVESRRSMLRQSALADGMDDFDQETPEDEARAMVGRWLSAHSEIAVITDAIDKTCETYLPDGDDEELAPDVVASWTDRTDNTPIRALPTLAIA